MKKENEKYKALPAEMFHFETWINSTNPDFLNSYFENLLIESGFTIVSFTEHYFPVQGYTAVWLLAESHLAIHTFPNQQQTYIQISSCNQKKLEKLKYEIRN